MNTIILKTDTLNLTEERFFLLCQENEILNLERYSNGDVSVKYIKGVQSSQCNIKICCQLEEWNIMYGDGCAFMNLGFTLPNKAVRSASGAWIQNNKFKILSQDEIERFAHVVPDFVYELKAWNDTIEELKLKMQEWIKNGCRLAWLINPDEQKVLIYRSNGTIEEKSFEEKISGEDVLPGFELDLGFMKKGFYLNLFHRCFPHHCTTDYGKYFILRLERDRQSIHLSSSQSSVNCLHW